jgi:hypothetical protein
MKLPSVIHPKRFEINGILIEVISLGALTDEEAARVAMHFYKAHKFKKKDQGKLFQAIALLPLS